MNEILNKFDGVISDIYKRYETITDIDHGMRDVYIIDDYIINDLKFIFDELEKINNKNKGE